MSESVELQIVGGNANLLKAGGQNSAPGRVGDFGYPYIRRLFFCAGLDVKADSTFLRCRRRSHQLADRVEDDTKLPVVPLFQIIESPRQLAVAGEHFAQMDESAHDLDVDCDGLLAPQHAREHATPCSVKAKGGRRSPILAPALEVTNCDLQSSIRPASRLSLLDFWGLVTDTLSGDSAEGLPRWP